MAREFSDVLREIRDGELEIELGRGLLRLVGRVLDTGKKGTLTMTLTVEANGRRVLITGKAGEKLPEEQVEQTLFYVGDDGELSRRDPRQMSLPELAEVRQAEGKDASFA